MTGSEFKHLKSFFLYRNVNSAFQAAKKSENPFFGKDLRLNKLSFSSLASEVMIFSNHSFREVILSFKIVQGNK